MSDGTQGYAVADYGVTFNDVENLEKKRSNFNQEAKAIHEATVGQWNKIYDELRKLANTYSGSPAFQESKLGHMFAPASMNGVSSVQTEDKYP